MYQRPAFVLLFTAMLWATIWWPFRWLEQRGVSPAQSSMLAYVAGTILALIAARGRMPNPLRHGRLLLLAIVSAACNFGYTVSATYAPVMKVLLLFYTAPLWTVLLARVMLNEHIGFRGALVLALCVTGELLMLWQPALGYPWPASIWEWLALGAGLCFALYNVLIRFLPQGDELPRMALVFSVSAIAAFGWVLFEGPIKVTNPLSVGVAATTGIGLWVMFVAMQWGMQRLSANQAAMLMTTELIFAAVFSWWWVGEALGLLELAGATLVALAALTSAWHQHTKQVSVD